MNFQLDQLQQIAVARSPNELIRTITRLSRGQGIDHWCYALDLPLLDQRKPQFLLGNFPQAWLDYYFAHDFLRVDPAVAHCHGHATPIVWPARQAANASDAQNMAVRRLYREAAEHGLKSGVSIPVHGLGCTWGMVSFASGDPRRDDDFAAHVADLHLFAHYIHESGHRFAHTTTLPPPPHLTARELECLHWAAEGKTSWEIGRVLGVSERTVVFHLQNAAHKFGVNGRQPAVARAIALGLIDP
ncbi:LuxR family transcriptional regulator [Tahibacter soli]|jgi:DNA-binding CsgD family transcriptional regulator|uniref:LuxR family transcriptional regulator n=1 Tax=Tahibacter soli TaxID=2983605 RepID=A0A9X3YNN0_9GAMM|nr:LuxR family transcriptional regulator [Tahibacter soli]MDC8014073.1 LuxR family transcriptional regulator [Tahibacter soli]